MSHSRNFGIQVYMYQLWQQPGSHLICLNAMLEAANRDSLKEHGIGIILDTHMQKKEGQCFVATDRFCL